MVEITEKLVITTKYIGLYSANGCQKITEKLNLV